MARALVEIERHDRHRLDREPGGPVAQLLRLPARRVVGRAERRVVTRGRGKALDHQHATGRERGAGARERGPAQIGRTLQEDQGDQIGGLPRGPSPAQVAGLARDREARGPVARHALPRRLAREIDRPRRDPARR
ncbi:MAG: hypothetical protein ACFBWO_05820 [Paracoccaceae bacterium]